MNHLPNVLHYCMLACILLFSSDLSAQENSKDEIAEDNRSIVADVDSQPARTLVQLQGAILKTIESTNVAAQLAGIVQEMSVEEGSQVAEGDMLCKIRDEPIRLKLEQLKVKLAMAKERQSSDINERLAEKSLEVAKTEYQRAVKANLRVPDTYPLNEIDRLRLVADRAQLEVERSIHERKLIDFEVDVAKSEYRQAYELFTQHQIKAPVGGVVVSMEKRLGEWVEPGTAVLQIVRLDRLRVEGFIPAAQTERDLVGASALVRPSAQLGTQLVGAGEQSPSMLDDSEAIACKVVFVSPDVNPVNSLVRVYLQVDNTHRHLRPGLKVQAAIILDE